MAHLEILKCGSGKLWPSPAKNIVGQCGLAHLWWDGLGIKDT